MIEFANVSKQYGHTFALRDVSLRIPASAFIAVTGRSGSGKTTLMNLIGNLDSPTDGKITVNGTDLSAFTQKDSAKYRLSQVGFIFQSFYLEPRYTVEENAEMPLLIAGLSAKERKAKTIAALESAGIAHKAKNYANTLSGGEKQRACIARALVNGADILLADEPCGNLDTESSKAVIDLLKRLHSQGKTIILVTHNHDDALAAQRRITLLDGRVTADES